MAHSRAPSGALLRALQRLVSEAGPAARRSYSSSAVARQEVEATPASTSTPDPATVLINKEQQESSKAVQPLFGSRRRRAALQQTTSVPFDALPYQCFQEARQILIADREQKLRQIETERGRIQRLRDADPATISGGEAAKGKRIKSMEAHLEKLKIYADINDPNVKRRFEDGLGDLNKPIYRFLSERKWREYRRKVQVQRIETMKVVPDVVPYCELEVDIKIMFNRRAVPPGEFVDSAVSENPLELSVQSFQRGQRLLTIAVIDPDVPNVETDLFESRCHFLATNITVDPTTPLVSFADLSDSQVVFPWLPPHAQKGSPYHRLSIIVLEQRNDTPLDKEVLSKMYTRDTFNIRSALTRYPLQPIGAALFRTKWDDSMADVMARHNLAGANIELKRKKVEPLPYKRRNPPSFR